MLDDRRLPRLVERHSRAGRREPEPPQLGHGVLDAPRSLVERVVRRDRGDPEAELVQRGEVLGRRSGRGDIDGADGAAERYAATRPGPRPRRRRARLGSARSSRACRARGGSDRRRTRCSRLRDLTACQVSLYTFAPMGVSSALARHCSRVAFDDVPPRAIASAKRSLLDALGVSLAASTLAPECLAVRRARAGRAGGGTLHDPRLRRAHLAPRLGARNGALAHALDFEDAHDTALVHPNAPVVPVMLALAEGDTSIDGPRLLTAMAVGCDVTCRLSLAVGRRLHDRGWYPPSLLAGIGAAAAGANLLRLDERQTLDAFSLVVGQLGGHGQLMHSPASVVRSVRDAFPAHAALASVLLARRGVRGYDEPLEGAAGLFAGVRRRVARPGHAPRGSRRDIRRRGDQLQAVAVVPRDALIRRGRALARPRPWAPHRGDRPCPPGRVGDGRGDRGRAPCAEASPPVRDRRQVQRVLHDGARFQDGRVTLDGFTDERLQDPALLRLAERIEFQADPSYRSSGGGDERRDDRRGPSSHWRSRHSPAALEAALRRRSAGEVPRLRGTCGGSRPGIRRTPPRRCRRPSRGGEATSVANSFRCLDLDARPGQSSRLSKTYRFDSGLSNTRTAWRAQRHMLHGRRIT